MTASPVPASAPLLILPYRRRAALLIFLIPQCFRPTRCSLACRFVFLWWIALALRRSRADSLFFGGWRAPAAARSPHRFSLVDGARPPPLACRFAFLWWMALAHRRSRTDSLSFGGWRSTSSGQIKKRHSAASISDFTENFARLCLLRFPRILTIQPVTSIPSAPRRSEDALCECKRKWTRLVR